MPRKTSPSPLAQRLAELSISVEECAAVVKRPVELVRTWIDNGPDTEGIVLLRFLDDDADALRRVEQLRRTHTTTLRGDGMEYAGIEGVPYGTQDADKVTGGRPA